MNRLVVFSVCAISVVKGLLIVLLLLFIASSLSAEVYPLRLRSGADLSSCVCVGQFRRENNWKWVFLTNRHVVTDRYGSIRRDIYVGNRSGWQPLRDIHTSSSADVASFTVPYRAKGEYKTLAFIKDVPNSSPVSACGYSERERFCFDGKLQGNYLEANGQHVIPGDSGGPVVVRVCDGKKMVGLIRAYRNDTLQSHFVPADDCVEHLCQHYGNYPYSYTWQHYRSRSGCQNGRCIIHRQPKHNHRSYQEKHYIRDGNGSFLGKAQIEIIENGDPPAVTKPETKPDPTPSKPEVDKEELANLVKEAVADWMKKYGSALAGKDGLNGKDGKSPTVEEVSLHLVNNHADELIIASSSFTSFLDRLEALENAGRPDLSSFNRRLAELEKGHNHPEAYHAFLLVDDPEFHPDKPTIQVNGQTKAIVDNEKFGDGDAFILDISNLRK